MYIQNFSDDFIEMLHLHGANVIILKWIRNFNRGTNRMELEVIPDYFMEHSYFFALMLQDAFPGGTISKAQMDDHIVYIYNDIAYDIEGVTHSKSDFFVPLHAIGPYVYKHRGIPGMHLKDEDIQNFIDNPGEVLYAKNFYNLTT